MYGFLSNRFASFFSRMIQASESEAPYAYRTHRRYLWNKLTDPSNASGRSALTVSTQTTSLSLSGYYCRNAHGALKTLRRDMAARVSSAYYVRPRCRLTPAAAAPPGGWKTGRDAITWRRRFLCRHIPRIHERDTHALEIHDIARDQRHPTGEGCRRYIGVIDRLGIWHMPSGRLNSRCLV